jgi:chromosome segregation ATPase
MPFLVPMLVIAGVSCSLMFGLIFFLKKTKVEGSTKERDILEKDVTAKSQKLEELVRYKDSYMGRGQYQYLVEQISGDISALASEKENLKGIEKKLEEAQKMVEEKETHQQEIKSSKEEDEAKVAELLSSFQDISSSSISLEQQLAASLKSLDSIMDSLEMTENQKKFMQDLSSALSTAGERMRDLVTEYQQVQERLEMLKQQHDDLEVEYTKLVEQQLGE